MDIPDVAVLVAYTDGLIERRGEVIDAGMERLRTAAFGRDGSLDRLVDGLASALAHDDNRDDTAIVAVRWQT
jgi:hypothetical protein